MGKAHSSEEVHNYLVTSDFSSEVSDQHDPHFAAMEQPKTSQSSPFDLPPKDWIWNELKQCDAVETGKIWKLDLKGRLHPFFHRKHWQTVEPKRFAALQQSFQLSTRLLQIAGPYFCNFFPRRLLLDYGQSEYINKDGGYGRHPIKRLIFDQKRNDDEIDNAHRQLEKIVGAVEWHESLTLKKWSVLGMCHFSEADPQREIHWVIQKTPDDDEAAEAAKAAGYKFRQVKIAINSSLVDAVVTSVKGSDHHMTAVFHAAISRDIYSLKAIANIL